MNLYHKLFYTSDELKEHGPITMAVFGDSITHGFFELDAPPDYDAVYWNILRKKLHEIRNYVPINVINAAVGGITATASRPLFDERVLLHKPDLIIICFGLNDVNGSLENYLSALTEFFQKSQGIDTIFLTPNMLNTYVDESIPEKLREYAGKTQSYQRGGKMDLFMESAVALAKSMNIHVCDCYSIWKEMGKTQDTTALLANKINHPNREMHKLFAEELYKIIVSE